MKVDSHIVRAIDKFIADNGMSYEDFARKQGVSCASITKWRKVGNGITAKRWEKLFPLLKKYLPADRIFINDAQREQYSSVAAKQSSYVFEPKYIPLMVPVFSMKQIATYDDMLESVTQFGVRLKAKTAEYRPKHKEKSSVFAVSLTDNALAPVFPAKTTLFVCGGERAENGGLVLALTAGKKAILGTYKRQGDKFAVISADGKTAAEGKVADAKKLLTWIFPVLYYEVVTF